MKFPLHAFFFCIALLLAPAARGLVPEHSVENGIIKITGVGPENPILYDNDWWTDVPDAAYLWAKASLGEVKLAGNVITRCTFGWETKYAHELKQQTDEAAKLLRLAKESGLKNIPESVIGSTVAMRKPAGGKESDTVFERTAGSALIIAEAKKATPEKPLLVFVGGSCTTIASAWLTDAGIAERIIVFQIDGGGYNGSDQWAWELTMRHFRLVNWARGYFWDKISTWKPARFKDLPQNPLCDFLREYAAGDLAKSNQWGDGAWLFQLHAPGCLTKVEDYDQRGITVPRDGNNVKAMEDEFFRTMLSLRPSGKSAEAEHCELRIYDVTPGKLSAVLERFRDAVEPIRRKHGIKTLAYWTASATEGDKFIYLMTGANKAEFQRSEKAFGSDPDFKAAYAASNARHGKTVEKITSMTLAAGDAKPDYTAAETARAFDLRIYSVLPGKLDAFRNRWRDHAVPIYERHGLHSVGWWVAEKKNADGNDQFTCLLAGESIPAIQKSISEFHKDEGWIRIEKETDAGGKLRSGVTAYKLTPTDFSALR